MIAGGHTRARNNKLVCSRSAPDGQSRRPITRPLSEERRAVQGHKGLLNLSTSARGRRANAGQVNQVGGNEGDPELGPVISHRRSRRAAKERQEFKMSQRGLKIERSTGDCWESGATSVTVGGDLAIKDAPRQKRRNPIPKKAKSANYFSIFSKLRGRDGKQQRKSTSQQRYEQQKGRSRLESSGNSSVRQRSVASRDAEQHQLMIRNQNKRSRQLHPQPDQDSIDADDRDAEFRATHARTGQANARIQNETRNLTAEAQSDAQQQAFR